MLHRLGRSGYGDEKDAPVRGVLVEPGDKEVERIGAGRHLRLFPPGQEEPAQPVGQGFDPQAPDFVRPELRLELRDVAVRRSRFGLAQRTLAVGDYAGEVLAPDSQELGCVVEVGRQEDIVGKIRGQRDPAVCRQDDARPDFGRADHGG